MRVEATSLVVNTASDTKSAYDSQTSLREAVLAAQAQQNIVGLGSGWTLNKGGSGSAPIITTGGTSSEDSLRISSTAGSEGNSAWYGDKINPKSFTAGFTYTQSAGTNGADGFTFTLQNTGLTAYGAGGGSLGVAGIPTATGIAFNIYSPNTVGFKTFSGGNLTGTYTAFGNGVSLTSGVPINFTVISNGTTVQLTASQGANTFTTTLPLNLAANLGADSAYVGFTGGTGGAAANQDISGVTISSAPQAAAVTFAPALANQTVTLADGWNNATDDTALRVYQDLKIDGGGVITVNLAAPVKRRILLNGAGTLQLVGLTLSGGDISTVNDGGAVWNNATLLIQNSRFLNNKAQRGGAVFSSGTVTIENSTFTDNHADSSGGAVENMTSMTIRGSTFNSNQAGNDGGAVHSDASSASLLIQNSTFAANTAPTASAIATGAASNAWDHLTVVDNVGGVAIDLYQVGVTMRNSIVARNTGDGAITSLGNGNGTFSAQSTNNLLGVGNWRGITNGMSGNLTGVLAANLSLGTLADNGGLTQTVALLPGSPAINAGVAISGITTDQRGLARVGGVAPDIGAYERAATTGVVQQLLYEQETRQALTLTFNADASVNFVRSAIVLQNRTTGQTLSLGLGAWSFNAAGTQGTLTLTNLLADGRYRATVAGMAPVDFAVFRGDADHDGTVNFNDLLAIARNYGQSGRTNSQGDANYDGAVDFNDLLILARSYNTTLATVPAAAASTSETRHSSPSTSEDVLG